MRFISASATTECDGDSYAQKIFKYRTRAFGNIGLSHRVKAVIAHFVNEHVQKSDQRADGHAEYRAGNGNGLIAAGLQKIRRECKTCRNLCQDLKYLAYRGRLHIAVALSEASVG